MKSTHLDRLAVASDQNIDAEVYWLNTLSGYWRKSSFPADRKITGNEKNRADMVNFRINEESFEKLMKLSNNSDPRLHMILAASLDALLGKYSGSEDVLLGTSIYKQDLDADFINTTLVLRNQLNPHMTFKELLLQVRDTVFAANENQNYPMEMLLQKLKIAYAKDDDFPLFDVAILLENIQNKKYISHIQNNLVLSFMRTDDYLEGRVEYNALRYKRSTIERIVEHFRRLLAEVLNNINLQLYRINILTGEEKERLLYLLNDTASGYPRDKTIHQLFETQVQRTPDNIAAVVKQQTFTDKNPRSLPAGTSLKYKELNEKSNRLARLLKAKGVTRETIVSLMVEPGLEMLTGILAILKAGGTYLPVDVEYPGDRIDFILKDSGTKLLLTTQHFDNKTNLENIKIYLDNEDVLKGDAQNLENATNPTDTAYIIYTSGTTGNPKGVLVQHNNVVRLMFNDKFPFDFNSDDVWTLFHTYCFDFSVWEMYGALLYGSKLVIIPRMVARDLERYQEILKEEKVTVLNQTPSVFYHLMNLELSDLGNRLNLKYVIFGGEALNPASLKGWRETYPNTKLINMFGITETTVHVTYKEITGREVKLNTSNIGKPIPTLTTYVMDKDLKILPFGVAGELFVGGEGVARGYLNRPGLTGEKFIKNPYQPDERLYCSGDRVRRLDNGEMEYLGRIDRQVKIRGFRIELGEIENQLLRHEDIKQAYVLVRSPGEIGTGKENGEVCAYIVSDREVSTNAVQDYLAKNLPAYMIPVYVVPLDRIPLTPNGKVDRKALPLPEVKPTKEYVPPRNETEAKLVNLWSQLLGLEEGLIGIDTNFFELGGHSLKATILVSKIHKTFNVKVPLSEVFQVSSLRELTTYIRQTSTDPHQAIPAVELKEYYDLSDSQKRLWMLTRMEELSLTFHIPSANIIEGDLHLPVLEKVFDTIMDRHESLRTVFITVNAEPKQKILTRQEIGFKLQQVDLKHLKETENSGTEVMQMVNALVEKPFDLSRGPLFRVLLISLSEGKYVIAFTLHHITGDAWSGNILFKEVFTLYNHWYDNGARHADTPLYRSPLKPLKIQYKDYTAWQNIQLKDHRLTIHREYWLNRLKGTLPVLKLPTHQQHSGRMTYNGDSLYISLDNDLTRELKQLAAQNQASLFMVLLAAFKILFYRYSHQTDIIIGTPVSGRHHSELEDQIGFYLNILALRTQFSPDEHFVSLLNKVKKTTLEAYEHQIYPFDQLVKDKGVNRDVQGHPFFNVVIDMINDMSTAPAKGTEGQQQAVEKLKISPFIVKTWKSKFDFTLYILEEGKFLSLKFEYRVDLFKRATIERMARRIQVLLRTILKNPQTAVSDLNIEEALRFSPLQPVTAAPNRDGTIDMPASYHQERLWFIDQFEAGKVYESNPLYHNIPLLLEVKGPLNTEVLEQSIRAVIQRHQALRTGIITIHNKPRQMIREEVDFQLPVIELLRDNSEPGTTDQEAIDLALKETRRPLPMDRALLIRGQLINCAPQFFLLVLTLHHIIADRYSLEIFLRELYQYYEAFLNNTEPRLPGLNLQYADFSQWQWGFSEDTLEALLFYWKEKLQGKLQPLELPTHLPRPLIHTYQDASCSINLVKNLTHRLKAFAAQEGIELFILFLAALKVLLYRYAGLDEIVVGTIMENREQLGAETIFGPIANLVVLRSYFDGTFTFRDVTANLYRTVQGATRHGTMPFDKLVQELNPGVDMSRTPLFDVLFQYEEALIPPPPPGNLQCRTIETNFGWGKYDLNLLVRETAVGFSGILVYNAHLFDELDMKQFMDHYRQLLESILEAPDLPISRLSFLTPSEEQQLLIHWNNTRADYPLEKTIQQVFEEQVKTHPHQIALVCEQTRLTYKELNYDVNRLACYLRNKYGFQPDHPAAILLDPSQWMIVALLAVLKAGGAYLPIDPAYPEQRIHYMLEDSRCKLLITEGNLSFAGVLCPVLDLSAVPRETVDHNPENSPDIENKNEPGDSAYVIYTSGTTGKPKGCLVSHENLVRLLKNEALPFDFNAADTWVMFHSYCFDFSVWEMYGALFNGGKLTILCKEDVRDTGKFLSILKQQRVTVMNQTPAAFYNLIAEEKKHPRKSLHHHLRWIIFGGDRLEPAYLKEWTEMYSLDEIPLINMYGITETTIHVSHYRLKAEDISDPRSLSPIGKPLPETTIYILNECMLLVPIGVIGEIYVGGSGVSRGYLNKPELTFERFCLRQPGALFEKTAPGPRKNFLLKVAPYPPKVPGKDYYRSHRSHRSYISYLSYIYKTGDLGRWLQDGNIEYAGRIDNQVKIRGHRVELGEIESQLMNHQGIKETAVIAKDNLLYAYIVAVQELSEPQLKEFLARRLPHYMVPSHFLQIEEIPLTTNGKIDRNVLETQETTLDKGVEFVAPQNEIERTIANTWKQVLKIQKVGIHDNFFDMGGHSLSIMKVHSQLVEQLGKEIDVIDLFRFPTVHSLAQFLNKEESVELIPGSELEESLNIMEEAAHFFEGEGNESD